MKSADAKILHGALMVTTCVVVWIEISILCNPSQYNKVTTCVVVWIEIKHYANRFQRRNVTTCVVVWIEIMPADQV